jgi:DHA2 family multidrug resistance protein
LLGFGLGLSAWSFYLMTGWTPDVSSWTVIWVGVIQGIGLGFLFTPLSVVSLATLPPGERPEGAGFYNLARNVGSSIGISIVGALLTRTTQANHASLTQYVTAVNGQLGNPAVARALNPFTPAGRAALDALLTQQAQVIAYIDDYKFLMIATLAVIPLLVVFQGRANASSGEHSTVAEI